jgi:hypothetical protein
MIEHFPPNWPPEPVAVAIQQAVADAINSDCDYDGDDHLEYWYTQASEDQQRAIDRVFIQLCGWTLRTLIATNGNPTSDDRDPTYNPFLAADGRPVDMDYTAEQLAQMIQKAEVEWQIALAEGDTEGAARVRRHLDTVRTWKPTA